jgi:ParB family chromosome partitioning protein
MKKVTNSTIDLNLKIKKMDDVQSNPVIELALSTLIYPTFKTRSSVDPKSLINLSANISKVGLLNPILVRPSAENKWEIISGIKRVMVFQQTGKEKIPAFVLNGVDDKEALVISLSDNLNRDDLNTFDQVYSFLHLMVITLNKTEEEVKAILNRIDNFDKGRVKELTQDDQDAEKLIQEILEKFGRIKVGSFVLKLRVLDLNPVLIDAVRNKSLHYTIAIEINKIKDDTKMKELLNEVFDKNLTFKEIKEKVLAVLGTATKPNPFTTVFKKSKEFYHLPQDKQQVIQQKLLEIQALLAA